jgi:Fe-S cluster assembly protein SufD
VTLTTTDPFAAAFEAVEALRGGDSLADLRRRGFARYCELGLPTRKDEEWRHTNLARLAKHEFPLADPGADVAEEVVSRVAIGGEFAARLVFVDGFYRDDLSQPGEFPAGVRVASLAEVATEAEVRELLDRDDRGRAFTALNTAFLADGAFVRVPKGVVIERPIQLVWIGASGATHPRSIFLLDESAEATIVESFGSAGAEPHLTNLRRTARVGPNGHLRWHAVLAENEEAFHVGSHDVTLERDARFTGYVFSLGGAMTRHQIDGALAAPGANFTIGGLFVTRGAEHVDHHLLIDHLEPHTESHQLFRGILDGRSSAVFGGKVKVHQDAQKTNATQENGNLLLSDDARVTSKPQLEIYADDVKCSHGATSGQIDEGGLFYLRSRGIPPEQARNLLIRAFAGAVLDKVERPEVQACVEAKLARRLPGGGQAQ